MQPLAADVGGQPDRVELVDLADEERVVPIGEPAPAFVHDVDVGLVDVVAMVLPLPLCGGTADGIAAAVGEDGVVRVVGMLDEVRGGVDAESV